MPWKALNTMDLRQEFVLLAQQEGANRRELCRRYGISPQTAYKWLRRYVEDGVKGLSDRSRRPANSPWLSPPALEAAVLAVRREHDAWGGRKISRYLADQGVAVIAPSTVTSILHWGCPKLPGQLTELGVWLVRLGIRMTHSRPRHPQTNGKDERFHRSLKAEVLKGRTFDSLTRVQKALDDWRTVYNHKRPHEGLQMATPITRYAPSTRAFPRQLPPLEYSPGDEVRTVGWNGALKFRGRRYQLSNALHRYPVAVQASAKEDGLFDVFFAHHRCLTIDLRTDETA